MLVQQKRNKNQNKKKLKSQKPRQNVIKQKKQQSSSQRIPAHDDYLKSLNDPFTFRGVRLPSMYPAPTQAKTISGLATITTNAAGYARVCHFTASGLIGIYNDATHTETTLGSMTTVLPADTDVQGSVLMRLVTGGMKLRSLQSFNSDAGQIHSYMTLLGSTSPYDVYRDTPYQRIYSKGEVATVRYLPVDPSLTELVKTSVISSFPIIGWNIGFMITGAPSCSYSLQYTFNYEYSSVNNTDLVPHQRGPLGDIKPILGQIHANGTNPSDSSHDFTTRVYSNSGISRLFDTVSNGFRAVNNFSTGGILSLLGSGAKFL